MLHKKGSGGPIVAVILIMVFAFVALSVVEIGKRSYFDVYGKDWACAISVRANAVLIEAFRVPFMKSASILPVTPPSACSTQYALVQGDKKEVIQGIVKLLGRCWGMFGTIPYKDTLKKWGFVVNTYNTCFNFKIEIEKNKKPVEMVELLEALNTPMNELFNDDNYPEQSFVEYVEETGVFGNAIRVDNKVINEKLLDKNSGECGKKSCTYYVRFYDGSTVNDPDGLVFSDNPVYTGKKGYLPQEKLLAYGGRQDDKA